MSKENNKPQRLTAPDGMKKTSLIILCFNFLMLFFNSLSATKNYIENNPKWFLAGLLGVVAMIYCCNIVNKIYRENK